MRLRVLDFGLESALRSQAVYHGLAECLATGDDALLTLVNPRSPYVCVGRHQSVALEVDLDYCRTAGLPVIRRAVGGGAVYLDRNQMFFHFIFPHRQAPARIAPLFARFIEPVVATYRRLGVPAQHRPINDIHVRGRKIGGTGAARIAEATLVVGSFLFDFDVERMARCLRVPSEKFRDKLRTGLDDYITHLRAELGAAPPREEVKRIFIEETSAALGLEARESRTSAREDAAIAAAERRLADPRWTHCVGRALTSGAVKLSAGTHLSEHAHKAPGGLVRVQLLEHDGRIADLDLTGDFTCVPADGVDALARSLVGVTLTREALLDALAGEYTRHDLQTPGLAPSDLADAVLAARYASSAPAPS